jgi:hypothetical protein
MLSWLWVFKFDYWSLIFGRAPSCARVGLFAASPRCAVGFPLLSLTLHVFFQLKWITLIVYFDF